MTSYDVIDWIQLNCAGKNPSLRNHTFKHSFSHPALRKWLFLGYARKGYLSQPSSIYERVGISSSEVYER